MVVGQLVIARNKSAAPQAKSQINGAAKCEYIQWWYCSARSNHCLFAWQKLESRAPKRGRSAPVPADMVELLRVLREDTRAWDENQRR